MATDRKQDYYDVLGVPRNAGADEIKKAFRRLAMQYHPDRNKEPGAEARFKEVNEAYEVLSDPERRAMYDRFGHAAAQGGENPFARGFEGFGFGGLGDIFDAFFGGSGARAQRGPVRGADVRRSITLTFEEAVFGAEKKFDVTTAELCSVCNGLRAEPGTQPERCPQCNGSGEIRRAQQSIFGQFVNVTMCDRCRGEGRVVNTPCRNCRGTGREKRKRSLSVKVPAGIDHGSQIRLTGEGEVGAQGGPRGNLYLAINVQPHELFRRDEDDILLDLDLNVAQAALGDEVEVPTVDGEPHEIRIPAGTQTGEAFVVRGRGVPHLRGGGRGDMIVRVNVVTPRNLSKEQKELFRQLAESMGTTVKPQEDRGFMGKIRDALG
ncbi:MAG TPA: molecular chaperone DnaJ [Dehalococcoidia bacterium]|nr:molecular chaperone DnaJ [Dehalococcoidia bacterium]